MSTPWVWSGRTNTKDIITANLLDSKRHFVRHQLSRVVTSRLRLPLVIPFVLMACYDKWWKKPPMSIDFSCGDEIKAKVTRRFGLQVWMRDRVLFGMFSFWKPFFHTLMTMSSCVPVSLLVSCYKILKSEDLRMSYNAYISCHVWSFLWTYYW